MKKIQYKYVTINSNDNSNLKSKLIWTKNNGTKFIYIYSKIKLNSKVILKYPFFIIKKRKILTVPTLYIHFLALEWKSAICDGYEICSVVSVA